MHPHTSRFTSGLGHMHAAGTVYLLILATKQVQLGIVHFCSPCAQSNNELEPSKWTATCYSYLTSYLLLLHVT